MAGIASVPDLGRWPTPRLGCRKARSTQGSEHGRRSSLESPARHQSIVAANHVIKSRSS